MREIKFRYIYDEIFRTNGVETFRQRHIAYLTLDGIEAGLSPFNDTSNRIVSRDEYTGLKDKNGKDIYEGDIVTWGFGNVAIEQGWAFHGEDNEYKGWGWIAEDCFLNDECEVIGNIHENPELIKDVKK